MSIRPLLAVGLVLVISHWAIAQSTPAAEKAPPKDAIAAALAAPVVTPATVLEEVRRFAEARIPRMRAVQSAEEWDKIARKLRLDAIYKVILRGEAARWAKADCKVEYLDTVPRTAHADKSPGYTIRKLRFEALPGLWIPALLYVPDKLEGQVPVSLAVNGHVAEGKSVPYKQIRCINQAKRGMIVLNVEWLGMGQLKNENYTHYRANQLDLCGASAVAPFYLSMKRSLDILLAQPHADPQRVAVSGLSGGGWQTIFISGLDERVTLANPVAGYSSFLTRAREPSDLGDTEQTPCDMATVLDYIHLTAMRAPKPTLLTFNSKDDCCFRSDHALQPLITGVRPIFALYGKTDNLRYHVNDEPGTHNFEQENREAFYKMLGDHFFVGQPFDWHEIPCKNEVKTAEQLTVPLPEDNENFNSLARKLMAGLPSKTGSILESRRKSQNRRLNKLREVVHFRQYDRVRAEPQRSETKDGLQIASWDLKVLDDGWTVPVTQIEGRSYAGVSILIADAGRKSTTEQARRLVAENQRVIAIDPFYFGEAAVPDHHNLYALLIGAVGERPLGIQAGQVAAVARWVTEMHYGKKDGPVRIVAIGPRTSTIALVAAALEPNAIGSVELHDPLPSLKQIIEKNYTVDTMPELFCHGLLQHFDVKDIAALIAPRPVRGL
jgi:hypothetical protein